MICIYYTYKLPAPETARVLITFKDKLANLTVLFIAAVHAGPPIVNLMRLPPLNRRTALSENLIGINICTNILQLYK